MTRPAGVTLIAVLEIIGGAITALLGFVFLLGSAVAARMLVGMPMMFLGIGGAILGAFFVVLGAVYVFVGVSLLNLANWARTVTIVLAAISLFFAALGVFAGGMHFFLFFAFRRVMVGAIDALIIWYLTQPRVKQAFRPAPPEAPVI